MRYHGTCTYNLFKNALYKHYAKYEYEHYATQPIDVSGFSLLKPRLHLSLSASGIDSYKNEVLTTLLERYLHIKRNIIYKYR